MSTCTKCKSEISSLNWCEKAVRFGTFYPKNKHGIEYVTDNVESCGDDEYRCSECDELLFTDEEKARRFLNGAK